MSWSAGLPETSPVAAALRVAEEEARAELDLLRARDAERQQQLLRLEARVIVLEGLLERERLQREQEALLAARQGLILALQAHAAERRAAELARLALLAQESEERAAAAQTPAAGPWRAWAVRCERGLSARAAEGDPAAAKLLTAWRRVARRGGIPSNAQLAAELGHRDKTTVRRLLGAWGLNGPRGRGPR